jgi:hypothetical protein
MGRRAEILLQHLRMVGQSVIAQEAEGRYTVLPIAIEAWLKTATANAEQLLAELKPDSPLLVASALAAGAPATPKKAPARKKAKRSAPRRLAVQSAAEPDEGAGPGGEHGGPAD